ncbi:hypothetical protein NL676_033338 [Syzygium grande]|nr:hypothetical protein NL676_033338 [Syzygium grande]
MDEGATTRATKVCEIEGDDGCCSKSGHDGGRRQRKMTIGAPDLAMELLHCQGRVELLRGQGPIELHEVELSHGGAPYLAMELLRGRDLFELVSGNEMEHGGGPWLVAKAVASSHGWV